MLKLPYTGEGPTYEADALRAWAGEGAVRLLERDEETGVLLLERLLPGSSLYGCAEPEEALLLACGALRRLWVPAPARPFPTRRTLARRSGRPRSSTASTCTVGRSTPS